MVNERLPSFSVTQRKKSLLRNEPEERDWKPITLKSNSPRAREPRPGMIAAHSRRDPHPAPASSLTFERLPMWVSTWTKNEELAQGRARSEFHSPDHPQTYERARREHHHPNQPQEYERVVC